MSEANKSLMLSEAEIIEAINSDSLISVSLGAGQPQKNVKMSTLATVVAGLLEISPLKVKSDSLYNGRTLKISRGMRSILRLVCYCTNGKGGFLFDIISDNDMGSNKPLCNTISLGSTTTSAIGTINITYNNDYIYVNTTWNARFIMQAFNCTNELINSFSGESTLFTNAV